MLPRIGRAAQTGGGPVKPRVALVGVSGFAGVYFESLLPLAAEGVIELGAAAVINAADEPEKVSALRAAGCRIYGSFDEMLSREAGAIDLCIIPTGIHLHASMTISALAAGCNVLLEKPAAATYAQLQKMREAERRSGRFIAVAYQHMYAPETMRLKEALLRGRIGEVQTIKCFGLWPRDAAYYSRNDWAGRVKLGNSWVLDAPFNNALAHWLNLALFFAGAEKECGAKPAAMECELYRARNIQSTDTACFRIVEESGKRILLWVSHACLRNVGPTLEVRGSRGEAVWAQSDIRIRDRKGESIFSPCSSWTAVRNHLLDAVFARIAGRPSFICGLDIAGLQTLCSNAAFDSAPIHSIGRAHLDGSAEAPGIAGIEEDTCRAFAEEKLWGEMLLPWAVPASRTVFCGQSLAVLASPDAEPECAAIAR